MSICVVLMWTLIQFYKKENQLLKSWKCLKCYIISHLA